MQESSPLKAVLAFRGQSNLNEDGDHSDAVRAPSRLAVVSIQILIIVDQLDL